MALPCLTVCRGPQGPAMEMIWFLYWLKPVSICAQIPGSLSRCFCPSPGCAVCPGILETLFALLTVCSPGVLSYLGPFSVK